MRTLTERAARILLWRILLASFVVFSLGCEENTVEDGGSTVDVIPSDPDDPFFPGAFVCDAFSGADDITDVSQGIVGSLFYLEDGVTPYGNVHDYINLGTEVTDVSLFFNQINIPTRPWDRGFVTRDGEVIQTENGDTLYEWFAMNMDTDIVLTSEEPEGDYQFAILSDDGAVLTIDGQVIVDNDGDHPTRFGCADTPISIDQASRLEANIKYYQGPRYHIAMIVMWRPWPENIADVDDPECGKQGNSRYFDSTQDPPTPQPKYQDLLNRGWAPLGAANFKVPGDIINMCNFPAPTISSIQFNDLGSTFVELMFSTNIPSKFYIEVTNLATSEVIQSPVSDNYVRNHMGSVTGLEPFTLYKAEIVASSVSGRETRSAPLNFRTRP